MKIFLCPSPDLYHLYHRSGATVIITDIFRASTTIVTAINNGAEAILPVACTEEAQRLGQEYGYLIAAERNVRRCEFADLGNDPMEYTSERILGKHIVLTTTNGTRSLHIALEAGAQEILIGSFLNLSATLGHCLEIGAEEVIVLAAGWQGQLSIEDNLYAGALAYHLSCTGQGGAKGDAAVMMLDLWRGHCLTQELREQYIKSSEHYARLEAASYAHTTSYCMQIDTVPVVVRLEEQNGRWWLVKKEKI